MRAEVDNLGPGLSQVLGKCVLQSNAGVIGGKRDHMPG